MGRIENPDLKRLRSEPLVGTVLLQIERNGALRAKWRSLSSARWSTLKKDLTQSDIVRDAIYQQLNLRGTIQLR